MKRILQSAAVAMAILAPAAAHAGVYGDDLGKCVVASTTEKDQTDLVVWMFAAVSAHPAVSQLSNVTPAQREAVSKTAAELFQRLVVQDCRKEAVAALKYEGDNGLEGAFELLGKVAMGGLSEHPAAAAAFALIGNYLDGPKLAELYLAAGIATEAE